MNEPAINEDGSPAKPCLGDHNVVWGVLVSMIDAVTEDPTTAPAEIEKATTILTGDDPAYAPMGSWNSEGIGNWIRGHMNGVPDGDAKTAVEFALAHLVLHQFDLARGVAEEAIDPAGAGHRMRTLMGNWTNLMLGVPYEHEPEENDEPAIDEDGSPAKPY
jgi:hypothetical protein